MNKKFIVWQIKRWIVPLAVFLGVIVVIFSTTAISSDVYQGSYLFNLSVLSPAVFAALIISSVFPLMAFSYKFGMQRCDFYNQLPFKPKEFKRTIMILGLICVLAIIIVGYATGVSLFALFYTLSPETKQVVYYDMTETLHKMPLDWSAVFYCLIYILVMSTASYFISSCIAYNNIGVFESIICLLLFHAAASSLVLPIEEYEALAFGIFPMFGYGTLFDQILIGEDIKFLELGYGFFTNVSVYLAISGGAFAWTWLSKDRSAEVDNTKGEPKLFPIIVLHAAFLFSLALLSSAMSSLGLTVFGLVLWSFSMVAYFFLNVLYKHGFGLDMKQWVPMIPVFIVTFILFLF